MSKRVRNWILRDLSILVSIFALTFFLSNDKGALSTPGQTWSRTDFTTSRVSLHEFQSGGPPKDGIPSIDKPRFTSCRIADRWLADGAPVIVVSFNRTAKAYPLSIMLWHEIVNDNINGIPVAITYCPLCSAAVCYDRRAAGQVLTFGTTGSLRKSDMVMYDRQTESWWQQYTGEALVGTLAGTRLKTLPSSIVSYKTLKKQFPDASILSVETGFQRKYGTSPYPGYDDIDGDPLFYKGEMKTNLPKLARVIGVNLKGSFKAYPLSVFENSDVLNDRLSGESILLIGQGSTQSDLDRSKIAESKLAPTAVAYIRRLGDIQLDFGMHRNGYLVDKQTQSQWNRAGFCLSGKLKGANLEVIPTQRTFAFSWFEFHPSSELFNQT